MSLLTTVLERTVQRPWIQTECGTLNVSTAPKDPTVLKRARRMLAASGLVGLVEVGDRDEVLDKLEADPRFDCIHDEKTPNAGKVALTYDSIRYEVIDWWIIKAFSGTKVGDAGVGGNWVPPKYFLAVRLYDRYTGRPILVLVVHGPPSVYAPDRDRLSEQMIDKIVEVVRAHRRRYPRQTIFVTGDFNFEPDHDNAEPLHRVLVNVADVLKRTTGVHWPDTLDKRHIDQVWYSIGVGAAGWVRLLGQAIVPANPKDHDGYIGTFAIRARLGHAVPGGRVVDL